MQLSDARKLDQKTQEALRHRAVLLVEKGATHMEAALAVGVHRGTVSRWCGTYMSAVSLAGRRHPSFRCSLIVLSKARYM
jgi:transposase